MVKITAELEDVGNTFRTFVTEAPKLTRKLLGTAVFLTSRRVLGSMEAGAPKGPDGQGLTPGEHIKFDLDENWSASRPLSARVGILDDPEQALVALWNEYSPDEQPFMVPAALANEAQFQVEAAAALGRLEKQFAAGSRTAPGSAK
jgi:hypothetical protein